MLPEDHPDLLTVRSNLAVTMQMTGDLEGARAELEAVLGSYERTRSPDDMDLLMARQNLAATIGKMGDIVGARRLLAEVVAGLERTLPMDHESLLRARTNLASAMSTLGESAAARGIQEQVIAVWERMLPPDHPDLVQARAGLANTLFAAGDLEGARRLEEQVLASCERTLPPGHPFLIGARFNLAGTMSAMGDQAGARALLESVAASYERVLPPDHPDLHRARLSLGGVLLSARDPEAARKLNEAAVVGLEGRLHADHPDLLGARCNLANSMWSSGDLAAARALFEDVIEDFDESTRGRARHYLEARSSLGGVLRELGELAESRTLQGAVLESLEQVYPDDHPVLMNAYVDIAITTCSMGDGAESRAIGVELAHRMLRRLELVALLSPREARETVAGEAHRHVGVRFFTALTEPEDTAPLRFELAETLRATTTLSAGGARMDDERRSEVAALRARLNDLVSGGPSDAQSADDFAAEVSRLALERDGIERELRKELAAAGDGATRIETAALAKALSKGAAAVGFQRIEKLVLAPGASKILRVGDVLVAHVLRADGTLVELELGPAEELAELARRWRASLGRPLTSRGFVSAEASEAEPPGDVGRKLRERILDPVLDAAGEARELYVCLDDFLHVVPLGALPLEDGVVRDRYEILNQVSFLRLQAGGRPGASTSGLLAVGNATFGSGDGRVFAGAGAATRGDSAAFLPLRETQAEVEFAASLFEAEEEVDPVLLLAEEATKASFHEHAPGKRFVHVATHGWFAPETVPSRIDASPDDRALWSRLGARETVTGLAPMTLCGIAMAGANDGRDSLGRVRGILTAEELAGVDLSACELAVLSACETNVGIRRAGQGIQSLQTALHAAGARSAITSLWKVDDAATRRLMERFYTYLWVEGLSKAEALWRAQCDLRAEGHPVRDWAAWVLSGAPD